MPDPKENPTDPRKPPVGAKVASATKPKKPKKVKK